MIWEKKEGEKKGRKNFFMMENDSHIVVVEGREGRGKVVEGRK